MLRVVFYLKGTPEQGILLWVDNNLTLHGWCDSDWAACPITRHSLTFWLVFLGQSPISWKTKKQHTVSLSSVETSMTAITCELKWLKGLLLSLGVHHPKEVSLFCDSQFCHCCTWLRIRFFISAQSTLSWIVILYEML